MHHDNLSSCNTSGRLTYYGSPTYYRGKFRPVGKLKMVLLSTQYNIAVEHNVEHIRFSCFKSFLVFLFILC